jgi:hypothetical protein
MRHAAAYGPVWINNENRSQHSSSLSWFIGSGQETTGALQALYVPVADWLRVYYSHAAAAPGRQHICNNSANWRGHPVTALENSLPGGICGLFNPS